MASNKFNIPQRVLDSLVPGGVAIYTRRHELFKCLTISIYHPDSDIGIEKLLLDENVDPNDIAKSTDHFVDNAMDEFLTLMEKRREK